MRQMGRNIVTIFGFIALFKYVWSSKGVYSSYVDSLQLNPDDLQSLNDALGNIQSILSQSPISHAYPKSMSMHHIDSSNSSISLEGSGVKTMSSNPTCATWSFTSPMEVLGSTCYNAVDYSFYIPAGLTVDYLESLARSALSNSGLSMLPNACQIALKKLVCSNIYLKCQPGIDLSNFGTYNYMIYNEGGLTIPMPFQRPCQSVCNNVNGNCLGLLGLLGLSQDCSARYDYSFGNIPYIPYRYDASNSSSVCNSMPSKFEIGSSMEPYIGGLTGACYGIVDQMYVPPTSSISSALAPLPAPYVIQSLLERSLASSFSALPKWLSEDCHFAMQKYFCRSVMIKAGSETFGQAFIAAGLGPYLGLFSSAGVDIAAVSALRVYMPSFPHRDVCLDYQDKCAAFIAVSGQNALIPNCSKTSTNNGITTASYPADRQTIFAFPVQLSSALTVDVAFQTEPDDMSSATNSYEISCPDGFVVPDEPFDPRVTWIDGSGCAMSCRLPLKTNGEYDAMALSSQIVSVLGIFLNLSMLIVWLRDSQKRRQYLLLHFTFIGLLYAIIVASMAFLPYESLCANNAVPLDATDGPTFCSVNGVIFLYIAWTIVLIGFVICFDLYLKVGRGTNTDGFHPYYVAVVYGLPLLPVSFQAGFALFGYGGGSNVCQFSANSLDDNDDIYFMFVPFFIMIYGQLLLMILVIYEIVEISNKASKVHPSTASNYPSKVETQSGLGPSLKVKGSSAKSNIASSKKIWSQINRVLPDFNQEKWKPLNKPFRYVMIIATFWGLALYYRFHLLIEKSSITDSITSWVQCIFTVYDGTNDWKDTCGHHPNNRGDIIVDFMVQGVIFAAIPLIAPLVYLVNLGILYRPSAFLYKLMTGHGNTKGNVSSVVKVRASQGDGAKASVVKSVLVLEKYQPDPNENL